jgi:pyruvate/2-oxoglutarate dehydrogenase complex dihydrolipoamide acyltransferase (E2) component
MDVVMPQLGETVAEGKIGNWFKEVGEEVAAGDNLFEIETDKVTMEVQAIESGVLSEIRVGAGETVPVGTVVAVIGGAAATAAPGERPAQAVPKVVPDPKQPSRGLPVSPFEAVRTPVRVAVRANGSLGLKVTPLARRLISQQGLELEPIARDVKGRGGWRIAAADVRSAPPARAEAPTPADSARIEPGPGDRVEPLNRIRARTAEHLAAAWRAAPHVFQAVEVDFSAVDKARGAAKQDFLERHGVPLTYLPFVARAACLALAEFPRCNAHFDGGRLVVRDRVNLAIAVDLDHEGLVAPVLRDAGKASVGDLARAVAALVEKARAGKLVLTDIEGGSYTITNNGSFGTLFTAPVINVPQVAILSFDAVKKRPVVVDTGAGDAFVARPVAMVGQSFDHRAMDGAYSAAFLSRLKVILETTDWSAEIG